jgi:glycosyltransferase involved in cell wall biosynthesis
MAGMRILHTLNHTQQGNGHVNVAIDLACEQAQQGDTVGIMAGNCDFPDLLKRHGVQYLPVSMSLRKPWQLPGMFSAASRVMAEFRPDVVHSHMVSSTVIARLVRRGRTRYGLVSTVHNSFDKQAKLMGWADRVVCVSEAVKQLMQSRGVPLRKLAVVRNGTIGSARRPEVPPPPLALERPSIATLAGLHHRKGVQDLIAAFALVAAKQPKAHLYIAGEGPMRAELEALARSSPVAARITFLGFRHDPRDMFASADVFVLASHADPFPLVILEAREAGCAIVASQVDGIPEALEFGVAGKLVPPQSPALLADAIMELLSDPAVLAEAKLASKRHADRFSVRQMVDDYREVYRGLIERAGLPQPT